MKDNHDFAKHIVDAISAVFAFGSLMKWLPAAASIFTIIWYIIRIWESNTVQKLVSRHAK
jgi:hypothetical protein